MNDSDAPANGEASNNTIEVVRNWWRCMDLEFISEAERGERSAQSDFFILIIFGGVNRHAPAKFIEQGLLEYGPIQRGDPMDWSGPS